MLTALSTQGMRGIKTIHIASEGGSINHAMVIAAFARRSNMTVIVSEYCISSCTIILASATKRIGMLKSSYLIHGASDDPSPSGQSMTAMPSRTILETNEMLKKLYIERGLNANFVEWAVHSPRAGHEKILTKEEALKIGLLTDIN